MGFGNLKKLSAGAAIPAMVAMGAGQAQWPNQEESQRLAGRMDEDLRMRIWAKIHYHPTLSRYNPNRGSPALGGYQSARRRYEVGISNDPPMGYHSISILANKDHVILAGGVDSEMDRQLAAVQANSVGGVFSVTNELQVLNPPKDKEKRK